MEVGETLLPERRLETRVVERERLAPEQDRNEGRRRQRDEDQRWRVPREEGEHRCDAARGGKRPYGKEREQPEVELLQVAGPARQPRTTRTRPAAADYERPLLARLPLEAGGQRIVPSGQRGQKRFSDFRVATGRLRRSRLPRTGKRGEDSAVAFRHRA